MDEHVGTVTDPVWYDILTALFGGLALAIILLAAAALVAKLRMEREAERRRAVRRRVPFRMQRPGPDTPIADLLWREYVGGLR